MESENSGEKGRSMDRGQGQAPGHPAQQVLVPYFQERLEGGEIGFAEIGYIGIGEAAEKEVGLARATAPGAKEGLTAARVEAIAAACGAHHVASPSAALESERQPV